MAEIGEETAGIEQQTRWRWRPEGRNDKACAEDVVARALVKWYKAHPGRRPKIMVSGLWGGLAAHLKERLGAMVVVVENFKPTWAVDFIDGGKA